MAENVELVIVRRGDEHSVLHGRCLHRGALLADGHIVGDDLICGLHGWDYRIESGVSAYNNAEALEKFTSVVEDDGLFVDLDDVIRWKLQHPQPYSPDVYQGLYTDPHGTIEEPYVMRIHELAEHGLEKVGHHGFVAAMGVPRQEIPCWDDIQFVTAQLARLPLLDDVPVGTEVCIGPNARQPLFLDIPLFVSDMSFGALVARGEDCARTRRATCGYRDLLGRGRHAARGAGREFALLLRARVGALRMVVGRARRRCRRSTSSSVRAPRPEPAVTCRARRSSAASPRCATSRRGRPRCRPRPFPTGTASTTSVASPTRCASASNGIPIGAKLSAQHIEADIDAALEIGVDYIILDGRGGGTGAAPLLFRDNISVPTIPALARARRHLDQRGRRDVTLVITGGLRDAADFAKALALGADAVAIANSAIQAIGCLGMRACHTDNCPVGIATQKPHLARACRSTKRHNDWRASCTPRSGSCRCSPRACGHDRLSELCVDDLTTFDRDMAALAGIALRRRPCLDGRDRCGTRSPSSTSCPRVA